MGYATHGLLDSCTSYGTQLFWPFSDERVAWDTMSIVDPLFTIPLLVFVIAAARTQRQWLSWLACGWMLGFFASRLAATSSDAGGCPGRQHTRARTAASFGQAVVCKSVGLEGDLRARRLVLCRRNVRVGARMTWFPGARVPKLDLGIHFPGLNPISSKHWM